MHRRANSFLGLFGAMLIGVVIGLHAQPNSGVKLAKLSAEKADISRMDLILMNTRIALLRQMLKDDLSLPLAPTSITYDADKQKILTSVYVDSAFLAKANAPQLGKTLDSRATGLCIAPAMAEGNSRYLFSVQPPIEYCAVRFFTHTLDGAGRVQTKDVASFEDGKLTIK